MQDGTHWIMKLNLQPHPEGGHFREIYRSSEEAEGITLRDKRKGVRNLATSIYYLLRSGERSCFHRLRSDEVWYFHVGSPLHIYTIDIHGTLKTITLGIHPEQHQVPQIVIPAGTIFGALVTESNSYSLVSCMVAPGFSFEDFEMISREHMLDKFPKERDLIHKLTHESKSSTLYY